MNDNIIPLRSTTGDPQPFDFNGQQVRVVMVNDEPHFIAADLCAVLDIRNSRDALARLDDDEKGSSPFTSTSHDAEFSGSGQSIAQPLHTFDVIRGARHSLGVFLNRPPAPLSVGTPRARSELPRHPADAQRMHRASRRSPPSPSLCSPDARGGDRAARRRVMRVHRIGDAGLLVRDLFAPLGPS